MAYHQPHADEMNEALTEQLAEDTTVEHEITVSMTNAEEVWLLCSCGWDLVPVVDGAEIPLADLNEAAQAHLDSVR